MLFLSSAQVAKYLIYIEATEIVCMVRRNFAVELQQSGLSS